MARLLLFFLLVFFFWPLFKEVLGLVLAPLPTSASPGSFLHVRHGWGCARDATPLLHLPPSWVKDGCVRSPTASVRGFFLSLRL